MIEHLSNAGLARLLDLELGKGWSDEDAAAALRHQLDAPLLPDLLQTQAMNSGELEAYLQKYAGPQQFRTQLLAGSPSAVLLSAIKLFAKQVDKDPLNPLSGSPAKVLYYAAIAAAELRCEKAIGQGSRRQLHDAYSWAAHQDGAESLKLLFMQALAGGSTPGIS